ncbi:MAG: glycosyltransferase family 2 protein [Armatimonadetes bacterium]|nr:glycosyltransferase family 2 protein [Armatimonadota bacterium]
MIDSLSIVYPMYNEKDNIETAVLEAIRVGYKMARELEVVVVDDASTDGCGGIADRLADEHPEVVVVHHTRNRKLGGALKSGFAAATREWVLYMDSDLPINMDDALHALPLTENADIVIGWRKSRAESWRREVMSKVYNRIIRTFFGLRVRDVNFAFKLFRRSFLDRILLTSEGSFIDAELLLEMQREGARLAELGMDYYPRVAGVSTLAGNRVVLVILLEMFRYRLEAHGKTSDNFSGERRRLWLERTDKSGDRVSVSARNSP